MRHESTQDVTKPLKAGHHARNSSNSEGIKVDENPLFTVDKNGKRVVDVDYFMERFVNSKESREQRLNAMKQGRPLFDVLNPSCDKYIALTQAKTCSLGFVNFKRAKLVAPLDEFLFKKYTKIATVAANKKFFRDVPDQVEFAKPFMPVSNWFADIQQQNAQKQFEANQKKAKDGQDETKP